MLHYYMHFCSIFKLSGPPCQSFSLMNHCLVSTDQSYLVFHSNEALYSVLMTKGEALNFTSYCSYSQ